MQSGLLNCKCRCSGQPTQIMLLIERLGTAISIEGRRLGQIGTSPTRTIVVPGCAFWCRSMCSIESRLTSLPAADVNNIKGGPWRIVGLVICMGGLFQILYVTCPIVNPRMPLLFYGNSPYYSMGLSAILWQQPYYSNGECYDGCSEK